ncbi:hypothetical protein [Fuerstiella marisgermanici]|uniref:Uncharacterized protein n=1 Tax=Fuerstiella marisgermanici TaxID=1891926 RepID=A0A1P8WCJ0_9PLAN|nr:hypothetical protein [Fuerstiella marisgermanici]APZ91754.1 hypothetical protein Fuma_01345 [Fuerstiella marisgermanici]
MLAGVTRAAVAAAVSPPENVDDDKQAAEAARRREFALRLLQQQLSAVLIQHADNRISDADLRQILAEWILTPDFDAVRAPESLADLPEAERDRWQKFWNGVQSLFDEQ